MDLLVDPEEKIQCPYDPAHHIMRWRMNKHLTKCKRNFPNSKLVECDFNVNHKIPEPELQYHHENCPDRHKIEHVIYREEGVPLNKFPVHNIEVEAEESWDNLNVAAYDPQKYCAENAVLRHKDVASAAQRKNFRMEERNRINQLTRNTPTQPPRPEPAANTSRRVDELPQVSNNSVAEDTPEFVSQIVERLRIGRGRAFVPRANPDQ